MSLSNKKFDFSNLLTHAAFHVATAMPSRFDVNAQHISCVVQEHLRSVLSPRTVNGKRLRSHVLCWANLLG